MNWRPIDVAYRHIGLKEVPGAVHNPSVVAMLKRKNPWADRDEIPWCAAFADYCLFMAGYHTIGSLRARSYMHVGMRIWTMPGVMRGPDFDPLHVRIGDLVVFQRGRGKQPGPDVAAAAGHVGFYVSATERYIKVLGGNQQNSVKISNYPRSRLLTVSRPVVDPDAGFPDREYSITV